jgi:hypothetical protein
MIRNLGGFPPFKDEDESSGNEAETKAGESTPKSNDHDGAMEEFYPSV